MKGRENVSFFYDILENMPAEVFVHDIKGNLVLVNERACKNLDYERDELLSLTVWDIDPEARNREDDIRIWEKLKPGENRSLISAHLRKDGTIYPAEIHVTAIMIGKRKLFAGMVEDITERQKLEEFRIQNQKHKSLVYLANGIAHDFNNVLMIIGGNISLLKQEPHSENAETMYEEIEKTIQNAKQSVNQIMKFGKENCPVTKLQELKPILQDSINLISRGRATQYIFKTYDPLPLLYIDAAQLSQVFHNLLINAEQSLNGNGKIEVVVKTINLDDPTFPSAFLKTQKPCFGPVQEYVLVSVSDNGKGIRPEHIDHVFDPYFTTKKEGMGIGLTNSKNIIQKHYGLITFNTQLGIGTIFNVFLPVINNESHPLYEETVNERTNKGEIAHIVHKILVMEDDPTLQIILKKMLETLGHQVVLVGHGEECINVFKQSIENNSRFNCILMDLVIKGGLGAIKTIKKIRKIDLNIKVILSSGNIVENFKELGFIAQLQKPYSLDDLRHQLQEIMKPQFMKCF